MATEGRTRIQLCGRFVVELEGRRLESVLPGRQGRLLLGFLSAHRHRPSSRSGLVEALWPAGAPAAADAALSALLSKLRSTLGSGFLEGKGEPRVVLPPDAWIDLEAASEGLHRAESAVAVGDWVRAWGPSRVALHITMREFMAGFDAPWIDDIRRHLDDVRLRAHECVASAGLGLGGPELGSAERSARALIAGAPFRETGYRFLMEALAARGNVAEALVVYDRLRLFLRDELGIPPGQAAQDLYEQLLGSRSEPVAGA